MNCGITLPKLFNNIVSMMLLTFFGWIAQAAGQIPIPLRPDQAEILEAPAFFTTSTIADAIELGQALSLDIFDPAVLDVELTFGRRSLSIQRSLQGLVEQFSPTVVEIVGPHQQSTLGTIVSVDGLVVAKYSQLPASFHFVLSNGEELTGKLIGIHPQNDLALIQAKAAGLTPITFELNRSLTPLAGEFVVSVGNDKNAKGFGMVTVVPQTFPIQQTECVDCIDLGATVSPQLEICTLSVEGRNEPLSALKVLRVYPRTASESIGLLVGDYLRSINGTQLLSRDHLHEIAKTIQVGQQLTIDVVRDGKPMELATQLKGYSGRTLHDRWGGGPFSGRRFGFGRVIAHDSVIDPQDCGGPLVTLEGRVIGINAARSMRVATFAIPIEDVYQFIKYVRPQASLVMGKSHEPLP